MGKPKDPDYFTKYRATHPEYAERDRARGRARKRVVRSQAPRDRTAEYARAKTLRAARAGTTLPPLPELHTGHELFEQARTIRPRSYVGGISLKFVYEADLEDARSEIVLALLEGRDPTKVPRTFFSTDRAAPYTYGGMPESVMDVARPLPEASPAKAIRRAAECHPGRVHEGNGGLCAACRRWALRMRDKAQRGELTIAEAEDLVAERLAG